MCNKTNFHMANTFMCRVLAIVFSIRLMIVCFLFQETNFLKTIQTEMISDTSYMSQPVRLLGLEQLNDLHKAFSQITYVKVRLTLKGPKIYLIVIHMLIYVTI